MRIKYVFLLIIGLFLLLEFKELPRVIYNFPEPFIKALQEFSLVKLHNTYITLAAGLYKIDVNSPYSRNCSSVTLNLPEEEHLSILISNIIYERNKAYGAQYSKATNFSMIGADCTSQAKLINFEFKNNIAYATFACETDNLVQEFTFSNTNSNCEVVEYKKEWGIKPLRTLETAKNAKFL